MKKGWLAAGAAGICAGTGICAITKKKQRDAEKNGTHRPYGPYEAVFKRPLDVVLSGLALAVLSPVMLSAGILVRIKSGSPVIFRQERAGLEERIFEIRKFRTMRPGGGTDGERLTDFGRKLRASSIDELPELWNILKGDMSVVGPRPLLTEYLPLYNEQQRHRHDVRPGLTGLAQAGGRNGLSWNEKFKDDVEYVGRITFFGDVKIIARTAAAVLGKKGISSKTCETMEAFTGNEE